MEDLSNEEVIQVNNGDKSYIQFRVLNNLGIKNAYTLKPGDWNFSHKYLGERDSYNMICDLLGVDGKEVTKPFQFHTDKVEKIEKVLTPEEIGEVDGLITDKKGLVLATTNADCILYLLYDKEKKVIGNVHSGWRGSYQRIIEKAIDKMIEEYDSIPEDIIVCICPSIRKCCFEVSQDVRDMFYNKFSFLPNIDEYIVDGKRPEKYYIDTVGINNELLISKGILKENIHDSNICSVTHSDMIHSFRAEGKGFKLSTAIITLD